MDSLIGRTLGRYQVLDEIGRGGMGVVYRAVDTTLHRDVALKILPPDLVADPDRRQRFVREARTASRLEHPHICVIHEVGEADGATFIAMELVRGERLSDALARGGMSTSHALQIATEVAEGLARAHEMSVIHRDVKPANVMITEEGHAKIIDFGLAKLVGALSGEAGATTAAATDRGVVMGTMAYMSPEQARAGRVDHRSDIFSFGVMAYEMLSGRQPFHGHSGLETLNAILHTPAPPLPALGPAVSLEANADMQRIIEKCLAKDPAARYQGMRDVIVDLRAARRRLESGSVMTGTAVPVAAPTAVSPWSLRRPVAIATVALIVVAIAAVVLWPQLFRTSPVIVPSGKPSVAVMHFENHTGKADLDWLRTGLTEMVVTDLSQSPDVEVLPTDYLWQILATLNRQNDRVVSLDTIQETARRAGVKYAVVGNYIKAGETIRINVTLQEAATGKIVSSEKVDAPNEASLFATVDDLIRRIKTTFAMRAGSSGPTGLIVPPGGTESLVFFRDLKEVTTASPEAYRYYVQGLDLQRGGQQREAVPLFEKAIAIDKDFALALVKLAVIHSNLGHPVQTEMYARRAMDLTSRLSPRERYYIEGFYYLLKEATMQKAIDASKNSLALYPNDDQAKHSLAVTYNRIGRTDEAIRLGEELRQRSVSNAVTWTNLAETYVAVGQFEAARQVMDDHLRRTAPNAGSHRFWGALLTVMGKVDEGLNEYAKADAIDGRTSASAVWLASVLQDKWMQADAIARRDTQNADPYTKWLGSIRLAFGEMNRGRMASALKFLEVAATGGEPSNLTAHARHMAAEILLAQGNNAAALAQATHAFREDGDTIEMWESLYYTSLAQSRLGHSAESAKTLDVLDTKAKSFPSDRERRRVHQLAGVLALGRADTTRAVKELRQAEAMLPAHGPRLFRPWTGFRTAYPYLVIWFDLGTAYVAAGNDAEAAVRFQRIVDSIERREYPLQYVRSLYFLGQIAERRGDREKARTFYQRFVDCWGDGDIDRERIADAKKKLGAALDD